ncbi:MAG: amino acid adenylation domain-containing protein, partial [Gemmatimonadetes bacterium]|nr:amino acid adenylation domain-containing protein [Gemmatimonadota bacterium]
EPGAGSYVAQFNFDLLGELDVAAFAGAVQGALERHAALRTGFVWEGVKRPVQVVRRKVRPPLHVVDWRGLTAAEREAELGAFLRADRARGFELVKPPLMRFVLLRVADAEHRLVLSHHQMVLDGWSLPLVFRDIAVLYTARTGGAVPDLRPARPYRDYVGWLERRDLAHAERFWREALAGFHAPTPLGMQREAGRGAEAGLARVARVVSPARTAAVQEMAKRHGLTMNTLVQGAWALLLARYAGEADVAFGAVVSGRPAELPGVEETVGLFINTLPVRVRVGGAERVSTWLRALQERNVAMREYEYTPLSQVQKWSDVPAGHPLFESILAFNNFPVGESLGQGERSLRVVSHGGREQADYPLTIATSLRDELKLEAEFQRARFAPEAVERMLAHVENLLVGLAAAPDGRLGDLDLLSDGERARILGEWTATGRTFPDTRCVHERFEAQAARTPDAVAVEFGDARLSYAELDARANRVARHLRRRGVGPETLVAVCLERSPELVVGVLGVLKAGGAYVPLDPGYPAERLALLLEDCGAPVLLTQAHLSGRFPADRAAMVRLDADWPEIAAESPERPAGGAGPKSLAYVIYTSGSTGTPKGVLVEHRSLANYLAFFESHVLGEEGFALPLVSRISFDASMRQLFPPLLRGEAVWVQAEETVTDGRALLEAIGTRGRSSFGGVPSLWGAMVELMRAGEAPVPTGLRAVLLGGEALSDELVERTYELFPDVAIWNHYGPTEATVNTTVARVARGAEVTLGRPIANVRVYLLDRGLVPVPVGIPGELYVGGVGVSRGYLRRPELTAEKFVPDPFSGEPGARLYRSGDRVRWRADGELEYLGRTDDQVKVRGFRIEPGEIEAVLERHPAVREAVVLVREDAPGERRLVAYLTADGAAPDTAALRAHLHAALPEYMIPSAFVALEAFPLTPNGKVDRRALPAPEAGRMDEAGYLAPRTPVEETLAGIWAEVLRVERVGVHDDYFELGGDSILSIQVVSRARRAGVHLTPRQLFEHPTVAELALVCAGAEAVRAEQGTVTGAVELTPIQRRFFAHDVPERHHWNMSQLFEVRRPLAPAALERAVTRLLAHHDALRMRFVERGGAWRQENAAPDARVHVTRIDLDGLPDEERKRAQQAAAAELQRSLRLDAGPLLRVALFDLGAERSARLLVVVHHLVMDGVSWRVLLEDLESACEQAARGEEIRLPEKTTSFREWAERLAAHARRGGFDGELGYWTTEARRGIPPVPVDFPEGRSANTEGSGRSVAVSLTAEETQALLQEVPRVYRTQVNDVLLAALARVMAEYTGDGRLLVSLEGHGREDIFSDVDLSRTVGWFTTVAPVLLDVRGVTGEGATLKAVKEQLRALPERGIGHGALRWLAGDEVRAALAALPEAELHFEYLGQFDGTLSGDSLFGLAPEPAGPGLDRRGTRQHLLAVSGGVLEGRLHLGFGYSAALHRRKTVERLAARFAEELRAIVAHCASDEAGGYTPSDFPLAGLDQAALDALLGNRRGIDDAYPLSPMQEGMLFHTLYSPGEGAYVGQFGFDLEGELDVEAFRRAWQAAVDRHPALRSGFLWEELDRPLQVVHRRVALPFDHQDWRDLPPAEQEARRAAYVAAERLRGFELAAPPLMRIGLLRLRDDAWHLAWTHHHLIVDGWSLSLVFGDVVAHYDAETRGRPLQLREGRPYREYVAWLQRQDVARAEPFWREAMAGFAAATPFGIDREAGARHGAARFGVRDETISEARTLAVQEMARWHGVTLNTVVQGAWALLLARYGGESDVAFGAVVSGRPAELPGVEETVGLFINTLPVRVRVGGEERVAAWLRALQERNVAMREYEYTPLSQVQRWSDVPAGQPLFESILVFENYPIEDVLGKEERALRVTPRATEEQGDTAITIGVTAAGKIVLHVEYDLDRFDTPAVARMLRHFGVLLDGMAAGAELPLSRLGLLTAAERAQVVEEWNATVREYPRARCVHELFAEQARRAPHAPAVVWDDGVVTYAELDGRADRLAHALRRRGVGPEVRVGICVERTPELAVAILGVLKAGGAYVPLDATYPPERLGYLLRDSGAALLLTQGALRERVPAGETRVMLLDGAQECPEGACTDTDLSEPTVGPEGLTYVIYTSGSTGTPKGVALEHGALVAYATDMAARLELGPGDRFLQFASLGFDVVVEELFPAWISGAAVVLSRADLFSPDELNRVVARQGVTCFELPTAYWHEWVRETATAGRGLPESVRFVIVGGERVAAERLREWSTLGVPLVHVFGLTETACTSTTLRLEAGDDGARWANLPVGTPTGNTRLYVLDPAGHPAPAGVPGELFIGGAGVGRGYLGRPELTAERFVPDPFAAESGARLYRTGDRVRWLADGNLEFLGRIDHQLKVRGFRIEPGEIEAALERHPAVREAVVVAREDVPGVRRLVAYLTTGDAEPTTAELREHLRERVPEYMVPGVFVTLDALPLTSNGKVDRRALPAPEAGPAPERVHEAPRTATERTLLEVWSEVLRRERIGIHDDFFELGGDSILSIQVVSRARRAGVHVTPRQLFENPTVAGLARVSGAGEAAPTEQGPVSGRVELTPVQAWFFDQPVPERHHWNMSQLFEVREPLDPAALERATAALLAHHDALRLRFREGAHGWEQENALPDGGSHLTRLDLAGVAEARQTEVLARAAAQLQASLRLESGPLFRVGYFERGEGRSARLLVVVHHLVMDGVSWRILLEDLQAAYAQAAAGGEVRLPEKTTSYRRWAERLAEHTRAGGFDAELGFWTAEARRSVAPLPVDHAERRRAATVATTRGVALSLTPAETEALLHEVPRAYRTQINDVLLTALVRATAAWTGDARLLVEMEGHGREELFPDVDLSRTVGWFTTLVPVLLDVRGLPGEGDALKAVKEQLRALPNRGIGHGALRWLADGDARARLAEFPRAEIRFEYLGQFDQALPGTGVFALAPEPAGRNSSPDEPRTHLLEVSGGVMGGSLRMSWDYSEAVHDRATVEQLAERFLAELRALIAHCTAPGAGGYTPSDFPLAALDQAQMDAVASVVGDPEDVYPLTPLQEGMLFHTLYSPQGGAYVAQLSFDLVGELDVAALERAWQGVVDRHPALRAGPVLDGLDAPVQGVRRRAVLPLAKEDWRELPEPERHARWEAYLAEDRARGFDLQAPPLMRVALFRTAADVHRMVWTHHQMILDGWSIPLLFRDLSTLYQEQGAALAPTRPYRDYVAWLRRQDGDAAERFWREHLGGVATPTPFGVDRGAPEAQSRSEGQGHAHLVVDAERTGRLREGARRMGVTVNTLVQGAWSLLLSRYGGEEDVVFGTTLSGRPEELEGAEEIVGLFINTLQVRVRVAPDAPVAAWLHELQDRNLGVREHGYAPLPQVQRWSGQPAGQALFESILVFNNYPVGERMGSGEQALRVVRRGGREQGDLPMMFGVAMGEELSVIAEYQRARFDAATVDRLLAHLEQVLVALASDPEQPLSAISVLGEAERRRVVGEWNAHAMAAQEVCVHDLIGEQARRTPEALALVHGAERVSYAELDARANRLANHLRRRGVGPEARVALCLERGTELVTAVLAVLRAGGAYVPLDPAYPAERVAFALRDSGASLLLAGPGLTTRLPVSDAQVVWLDKERERIAAESPLAPRSGVGPEHLAYVIYTSGSTGLPKGVRVEHRHLAATLLRVREAYDIRPADEMPSLASYAFDIWLFEVFLPL